MFKSVFCQRVRTLLASGVSKANSLIVLPLLEKFCLGHIDGVAICDLSFGSEKNESFFEVSRQAMALIQTNDLRRYQRVCRYLRFIVNWKMVSQGSFLPDLKLGLIDYSKYTSDDFLDNLRRFAGVLIHEATHSLLLSKGIPYDKQTRERVERLCFLEQYRFALHFEPGYAEHKVQPFKVEIYQRSWKRKTWFAELKRTLSTLRGYRLANKNHGYRIEVRTVPKTVPNSAKD